MDHAAAVCAIHHLAYLAVERDPDGPLADLLAQLADLADLPDDRDDDDRARGEIAAAVELLWLAQEDGDHGTWQRAERAIAVLEGE